MTKTIAQISLGLCHPFGYFAGHGLVLKAVELSGPFGHEERIPGHVWHASPAERAALQGTPMVQRF